MKTRLIKSILLCALMLAPRSMLHAATTGRSEDSSIAGTEKVLSDSSGADTYILVSKLWTSPVIATGLTASGSAANDFSGSTGTFLTSTGIGTFGGSANNFTNVIQPTSNDGAALGSSGNSWADLYLASGAVINYNNGNVTLTHTSGVLTVSVGDRKSVV